MEPLSNPRWERYAQERAAGKSQRQAYLVAYPNSNRWKPETVDNSACKLEKKPKVSTRLSYLEKRSASKAVATRTKALNMLNDLAQIGYDAVKRDADLDIDNQGMAKMTISALKELIPYTKDEEAEQRQVRTFDFALHITRDFLRPHRLIAARAQPDYWATGGRGSAKSSWASLEVVNHIERNPEEHGLVLMKYKNAIRDAAYAQITWAISALGLDDEYDCPSSTFTITKRSTGQLILFRGCDNPTKTKSIKVPFGNIGIVWFEEADMFAGMKDIRTVNQSVTRGGSTVRLYTFNPPRSVHSWINVEMQKRLDNGLPVFHSNYLNVPREWLGDQFFDDAELLRLTDEKAFRHEYMGEPVGMGSEVFDPEKVIFREITDEEILAFDNPRVGQDFGWYPDPWACVMSEWRPGSMTLLSYREEVANKLTPDEQAKRIKKMLTYKDSKEDKKAHYHHVPVRSDDAEPTIIQQQKNAGIKAMAANKGNMRGPSYRLLQACTWVIDPKRCPNLANEVRNMQYEVAKDGTIMNTIPDGNDHSVDAVRYAFMEEARSRYAYRATPRT